MRSGVYFMGKEEKNEFSWCDSEEPWPWRWGERQCLMGEEGSFVMIWCAHCIGRRAGYATSMGFKALFGREFL